MTKTSAILNDVDVPLVNQTTCQALLKKTKLGNAFALDKNSFICAGKKFAFLFIRI